MYPVPGTAILDCLIVHWGVPPLIAQQPGRLAFPSRTQLTEENLEAVLGLMMRSGGGYDFIEVRFKEIVGKAFVVGRGKKKVTFGPEVEGTEEQGKGRPKRKGKGADRGFQAPDGLNYSL